MKIKVFVFFMAALFAVNFQATAQESTAVLLEKAQAKAKKEGKSVFIKFEASWCGWCHKMTKDMKAESTKKFFEDNFVTVAVVVKESPKNKKLENPGGDDLIKKYNNGNSRVGLPFWIILDSDLKVITNSYDSNNQNLGGPASPAEVKEFIKKLKMAVATFSEADAAMITKQFEKKK
ncbi:MAG: thioredoxin family protein [Flavobacteriaceae bacterium]|nr:thioredoxin family protein [Flavobacteriaceae bacterium]